MADMASRLLELGWALAWRRQHTEVAIEGATTVTQALSRVKVRVHWAQRLRQNREKPRWRDKDYGCRTNTIKRADQVIDLMLAPVALYSKRKGGAQRRTLPCTSTLIWVVPWTRMMDRQRSHPSEWILLCGDVR